jgi:hypothetical protein
VIQNKKDEEAKRVGLIFAEIRTTVDSLERDAFELVNRGFSDLKLSSESTLKFLAEVKINSTLFIEDL